MREQEAGKEVGSRVGAATRSQTHPLQIQLPPQPLSL